MKVHVSQIKSIKRYLPSLYYRSIVTAFTSVPFSLTTPPNIKQTRIEYPAWEHWPFAWHCVTKSRREGGTKGQGAVSTGVLIVPVTWMAVNKLSRSVGRDEVRQLHSVQTWKIWCYQLRAALLQILSPPGIRWNHQASATDPEIVLCHRASVAAQLPLREHSAAYYFWNTNPRPLILLPCLWMSTATISKAVMKIF